MANLLTKDKKITFVPGHPAIPAYPGQPWMPARTVQETQRVCSYQPVVTMSPGTHWGWYYIPADPLTGREARYEYMILSDATNQPTSGYSSTSYTYTCTDQLVTVTYPSQPYIPPRAAVDAVASQTLIDLNLGWNAGARSIGFLLGSGRVEYKVAQNVVGVVSGLNDIDVDAGYTNIDFAWYFSGGTARVYEDGIEKFYAGPYVSGDVFAVERLLGIVRYKKNGSTLYTSSTYSGGAMFLDASLYAGDDALYDPIIVNYGTAQNTLAPFSGAARGSVRVTLNGSDEALEALTGVGGISATMVGQGSHTALLPLETFALGSQYTRVGISHTSLLPLTLDSRPATRSAGVMAPLVGQGSNKVYGASATSLEAMTVFAQGGMPMPAFSISNTAMLYLTSGGSGLTGEIGGSAASLSPLLSLASGDDSLVTKKSYGQSVVSLAPLAGYASAFEGNTNATLWNMLGSFDRISPYYEVLVLMNERLEVTSVLAVEVVVDAALPTEVDITDTQSVQALLDAALRTTLLVGFGVPVFDQATQVWALNTSTQASSLYEGFDFNSFGQLGGHYYGCKTTGLYRLEGADDNGVPIRASVNLGLKDFGKSELKHITNAYIGVASDGSMVLKVSANGADYFYTARANDTLRKTQRFDVGKGLRANYFELELFNTDGADFDLSRIEFAAVVLNRRI